MTLGMGRSQKHAEGGILNRAAFGRNTKPPQKLRHQNMGHSGPLGVGGLGLKFLKCIFFTPMSSNMLVYLSSIF